MSCFGGEAELRGGAVPNGVWDRGFLDPRSSILNPRSLARKHHVDYGCKAEEATDDSDGQGERQPDAVALFGMMGARQARAREAGGDERGRGEVAGKGAYQ